MDRKQFFDAVRKAGTLGVSIPQTAVTNVQIIIEKAALHNATAEELAYMLATARHEVGPDMVPKRESLNYHSNALLTTFKGRITAAQAQELGRKSGEGPLSVARQMEIANIVYGGEWGRVNLGNTKSNDGWALRGGGYPQTTGRANYGKVGALVGVDLLTYPARIVEPDIAATALVVCMLRGTYTGKKLSDYRLPAQFKEARAIINNDVAKNGAAIAGYANAFLTALKASGYSPASVRSQSAAEAGKLVVDAPAPRPVETPAAAETPVKTEKETAAPVPKADKEAGVIAGIVVGFIAAVVGVATWLGSTVCEWTGFFCGG